MKSQLFIPDKIRVGYQKRPDTYTQKLAYIIYYDKQGKIHKERSFESWRHKDIPVEEFENKPHSGFVLNKDVKRSSEWFGNGRNMIRIYDDRGMEFEITTGNLLFILMTTNCHKRGLEGEFVYAWTNSELVLLPTGCDEYRNSVEFSDLKAQTVKKKNVIPGCSYRTKGQDNLIYLGEFDYTDQRTIWLSGYDCTKLSTSKKYIFLNSTTNEYVALKDFKTLAIQLSDIPVSTYAELIDAYSKSIYSSKPIGYILYDKEFKLKEDGTILNADVNIYWQSHGIFYRKINDLEFGQYYITPKSTYNHSTHKYHYKGYDIKLVKKVKIENGNIIERSISHTEGVMYYNTFEEAAKYGFSDLKILFDNASTIEYEKIKY